MEVELYYRGFGSDEIVVHIVCPSMLGVVLGMLCLQLCVSNFFPSEMLAAQVLVCQSIGLKCWKFCGCLNSIIICVLIAS